MGKDSLCAESSEEWWFGAVYGKHEKSGKRGVAIDLTTTIEEDNFFTEAKIPAVLGL
jgi:hypothetical protein